jgi:hypothetical protein
MPVPARPTLAEIYATLNQLVDAYGNVMMTFSSVVTDVAEVRNEIVDLKEFNRGLLTDAVSSQRVWQAAAEAHKAEAAELRAQLAALGECSCG